MLHTGEVLLPTGAIKVKEVFKTFHAYHDYVVKRAGFTQREQWLIEKVRGKACLDIGCLGHKWTVIAESSESIFNMLKSEAKEITGVDYLKEDVAKLQEMGYTNVVYGDAVDLNLNRKFDVIILGDLIEHLYDFKGLFKSVKAHLHDQGEVIITTPNPFYINQFIMIAIYNKILVNKEHKCWFDPSTIFQMLASNGFEITEFFWLKDTWGEKIEWKFTSDVRRDAKLLLSLILRPLRMLKKYRTYFCSDFAVAAKSITS
jgi:2-polyprenyl-3-methyl-5-hydroxy-6-metoxy-1,4-benzoquinol methylase